MRARLLTSTGCALLACAAAAASAPAVPPPIPIPGPLDGPLPRFEGGPATAQPLFGRSAGANPALAPNGRSGSGLAAGNGGASPLPGPLGRGTTRASAVQFGTCSSLAFDAAARLVAACNGPTGPALRLIHPGTLATLAAMTLPVRPSAERTDLAGGTHFISRADGRLVVPTNGRELVTVAVGRASLRKTGVVKLAGALRSGERPFALGAGFDGRDWVAGNQGTVVTVPWVGGRPRTLALGEPVAEDIATDPSGTYVVTSRALYRLQARRDGTPRVVWRQPLPSGPEDNRAGRIHDGPGTPPAIVPGGFVAVADGLNPPRITVVRIAGRDSRRLVCAVPVFRGGRGSIEAHLVVAGQSVVATNSYGYQSFLTTEGGRTTTGGIARILIGERGCRRAWTSAEISPSAQPVVSRATGLLYTLVKPAGFPDAWYLAALDWRTGRLRFRALAGEGLGHNSEGGAVVLGPNGAAYAGTFGGVVRFRDRG